MFSRWLRQNGGVAIYHFSAKVISRGDGRSSTAAAAYRAGERIEDERTGEVHDYRRKGGVVGGGVILPAGGTIPRAELWNKVEAKHKRSDAVVAREFELALPAELSDFQRLELTVCFAREVADLYSVAVDYNVHAPNGDERNHHAHIMLSACYFSASGQLGKKAVALDPIHCRRAKILNPMEVQRSRWQDRCNDALERSGFIERIDHRTLMEQGITDRLPGVHLGPFATSLIKRGKESHIQARAHVKAAEFIVEVQANVALQAAARCDVQHLEAALAEAIFQAERMPTKQELEADFEPMLEQIKASEQVIIEDQRCRSLAQPLAKFRQAQKTAPSMWIKTKQAKVRPAHVDRELTALAWWRLFKRRKLVKSLMLANRHCIALSMKLLTVEKIVVAPTLEHHLQSVQQNKELYAAALFKRADIERQLAMLDAQTTGQKGTSSEAMALLSEADDISYEWQDDDDDIGHSPSG